MNRILEFQPSAEEAVVSRILVLVHRAVDQHLPSAGVANRQFTKTVFSDDGERTALTSLPRDTTPPAFGSLEDTSPDGRPAEGTAATVPPPPPPRPNMTNSISGAIAPPRAPKRERGLRAQEDDSLQPPQNPSRATGLETGMQGLERKDAVDWTMRVTLALLIAGLLLLAYVLLA